MVSRQKSVPFCHLCGKFLCLCSDDSTTAAKVPKIRNERLNSAEIIDVTTVRNGDPKPDVVEIVKIRNKRLNSAEIIDVATVRNGDPDPDVVEIVEIRNGRLNSAEIIDVDGDADVVEIVESFPLDRTASSGASPSSKIGIAVTRKDDEKGDAFQARRKRLPLPACKSCDKYFCSCTNIPKNDADNRKTHGDKLLPGDKSAKPNPGESSLKIDPAAQSLPSDTASSKVAPERNSLNLEKKDAASSDRKQFSICSACNKYICLCSAEKLRKKVGRKKLVLLKNPIADLVEKAKLFALNDLLVFESRLGRLTSQEVNPGLKQGCMALQRYWAGMQHLGLKNLEDNDTVFAWHGTTHGSIAPICSQGFNPGFRSGQVHGPGEYFGTSAPISIAYNRGCNRLIVVQIVKCREVILNNYGMYIVHNPMDWRHSFNLPVLVFSFDSTVPPPILWVKEPKRPIPPPFQTTYASAEDPSPAKMAYRWYWTKDDGCLEPYPDMLNQSLEEAYQNFCQRGGSSVLHTLLPIGKQCECVAVQSYKIDLICKSQTNQYTGKVRMLERRLEEHSRKS